MNDVSVEKIVICVRSVGFMYGNVLRLLEERFYYKFSLVVELGV